VRPKKILIAGASTYGVRNMGDDAMLYNLTHTLHQKIDCEITFLARHPETAYDELYGIRSIKNYEFNSKKESLGKFFYGFNPGDPGKHLEGIREAIKESDLIVIGGNSFMEVFTNQFMRGVGSYASLLAIFAKLFNKPYVLYGVAGHPLKNELTKEIARFLCGNAELVTIREEFFKNALRDVGIDDRNLKICGDPAFGIDPVVDMNIGKGILKEEGITFKQPNVVGIAFRHMYWRWNEKEFETYSQKMANLCDFAVQTLQADLLFIPNCTYNVDNILEDDRHVADFVIKKMKNKASAHLVKKEMSLTETLSLYPHIDMLIANRRHSCIFGAVHGKPMLAMSTGHHWQFKHFMDDLTLGDYTVSFTEDALDKLKKDVCKMWEHRKNISSKLAKPVSSLRDKAHNQADLFIEVMNRKTHKKILESV